MSPDRERGFIVIQRQIQSSPIWLSMTCEQRGVFNSILLLANWTPGRFMYAGHWVEVGRGELAHSLESIAKHAKVSIKVVRTTIDKLIACDSLGTRVGVDWNANGHSKGTPPGTEKGTGPRILIVRNYNKHQDVGDAAGTGLGMESGEEKAQQGHDRGTTRAPIEPSKPFNQESLSPREVGAAMRQAAEERPPLDGIFPATATVLANLRSQGISIRHAQTPEDRAALEQAIAEVTTTVATQRVAESFRLTKRASLGWHLEAITGKQAKPAGKRGMAPPSTDFTSPEHNTL